MRPADLLADARQFLQRYTAGTANRENRLPQPVVISHMVMRQQLSLHRDPSPRDPADGYIHAIGTGPAHRTGNQAAFGHGCILCVTGHLSLVARRSATWDIDCRSPTAD